MILTLSCRTETLEYYLFGREREIVVRGRVERVGRGGANLTAESPAGTVRVKRECWDHRMALALVLEALAGTGTEAVCIKRVGHRVAHGGETFRSSAVINGGVLEAIKAARELAPLHNGPNLAGIEAALELLPAAKHVAVFDTAFHQTMPEHAFLYPLPYDWYRRYGVRRYGFHGGPHRWLARRGAQLGGRPLDEARIITVYLDRGVSLCAVRGGVSIDTSMGFTPLEGAMMETRCGDIDAGIQFLMMGEENLSPREMDSILNLKSGARGITGEVLSRGELLEKAEKGEGRAPLALEMEAYRLRKYVGAYLAVLGGADAVVFSTGITERAWLLRERVLEGLGPMGIILDRDQNRRLAPGAEGIVTAAASPVPVFVVPAAEEMVLAEETAAL
jgi:acetate kinase